MNWKTAKPLGRHLEVADPLKVTELVVIIIRRSAFVGLAPLKVYFYYK